jgi:hypothetical protein
MDERRRFVARLREGEAMTDICREFGRGEAVKRIPAYVQQIVVRMNRPVGQLQTVARIRCDRSQAGDNRRKVRS